MIVCRLTGSWLLWNLQVPVSILLSWTLAGIILLKEAGQGPLQGWGLAFMNAPKGSLIAYATAPGSTASDGSGKNGLYTSALLESIRIPNINILQVFQNVRNIVTEKSAGKQTPWNPLHLQEISIFNIKDKRQKIKV